MGSTYNLIYIIEEFFWRLGEHEQFYYLLYKKGMEKEEKKGEKVLCEEEAWDPLLIMNLELEAPATSQAADQQQLKSCGGECLEECAEQPRLRCPTAAICKKCKSSKAVLLNKM
jgi:hypothetical protein